MEGTGGSPPAKGGDSPPPQKTGTEIRDWFLKTAAAIVGGLGTAGAMVVIGSAVLWVRFKEAGIPAVQAVSVQPRQEALVQGAQTTIFFVLAALAVVVFLYIVDFPKEDGADPDPGAPKPIRRWTKRWIRVLPVVGIVWVVAFTDLGWAWVAGLAVVAALLAGGCLWIGHQASKNFWALAAAVFVSIIVFAGVAEFAIVQSQKFVQAVAILRGKEDAGLAGYYVAVTDSKIYFANSIGVEGATMPERKPMQTVNLGDEVTYAVGPLESQASATARAEAMLARLVANREAAAKGGRPASTAFLPAWFRSADAAAFGAVDVHTETPEALCLMRFFGSATGNAYGPWWTSCREAEDLSTVDEVRAKLALPPRFQPAYDRRVKVEVPAGTPLDYVEGDTAPQCNGSGDSPCGRRFPGGGAQYWIRDPEKLGKLEEECTEAAPNEEAAWHECPE